MEQQLKEIIAAGIKAPSGDNCQPWRFRVLKDRIELFNVPERDTSLYNFRQRASLVAHGACVENMLIAARALGFSAELSAFPNPGEDQHVATLTLQPAPEPTPDPLYGAISERTINRKKYAGAALAADAAERLEKAAQGVPGARLILLRERAKVAAAADVVALSDRLVFENPLLHGFLFHQIRWTAAQAEASGDGLDLRTLELAPPDRLLFPLLKNFGLVNLLGKFGVTGIIAANARKLMLSASAAGVIVIKDTSPESWLAAGRLLERVWLEATRQGLAFHLMTGITLLVQSCRDGASDGLSQGNRALVARADALLSEMSAGAAPVALLFRVGTCAGPSARSLRQGVDDALIG
jgi:hypothetical protein